ncbi:MAG: DUF4160 domain-containing protein, partial [Bacteroidota bacterium]
MPTIHIIGAIRILMYFNDHAPPHFHAAYNEYEALISIHSLAVLRGSLPRTQQKIVLSWAKANQEFLMTKWS